MLFQEKKTETGFSYFTEDVFGKVYLDSPKKLNEESLDNLVMVLLGNNAKAAKMDGFLDMGDWKIKYKFYKTPMWGDDAKNDICTTGTSTSTSEQEEESPQKKKSRMTIFSWFKRFVAAFREALKNSK